MYLVIGVLFVMGINLAGAEGDWFPVANIIGVVMFFCSAALTIKVMRKEDKHGKGGRLS